MGIMEIIINWEKINSEEDFYNEFLPQVKAPDWHGRNLNALADSIITGDINNIEPPFTILNIQSDSATGIILELQIKVLSIFSEAIVVGREIVVLTK